MTGLSTEICYDYIELSSGEYNNPTGSSDSTYGKGGTCYDYYSIDLFYNFRGPVSNSSSNTIRVAQNAQ